MPATLAFDVYGTLIDTHGVALQLEAYVGSRAGEFSRMWREKQLEYSFRRGLMRAYADFRVCTADALEYTRSVFNVALDAQARQQLLAAYASLPAFGDVEEGLIGARQCGFRMFAFSNGVPDAVEGLLQRAGIRHFFQDVISVDEVKTFKPDPAVYGHFLKRAGAVAADAWLISSNPFDVIGAISSGMRAAWVRRSSSAVFDPWGMDPTIVVDTLSALAGRISSHSPRT